MSEPTKDISKRSNDKIETKPTTDTIIFLFVSPTYFKNKANYLSQKEWTELWNTTDCFWWTF